MVKKNKFGIPPDADPRWKRSQIDLSKVRYDVLPIGTLVHPSGWAYMDDYSEWKKDDIERKKKQEEAIKENMRILSHRNMIYEAQALFEQQENELKKVQEKKRLKLHKEQEKEKQKLKELQEKEQKRLLQIQQRLERLAKRNIN